MEKKYNPVTNPEHYNWIPGIECKEVAGHFPYFLGCAIKYIWRCEHKGNKKQDIEKAIEYLKNEIELEEK